MYYLVVFIVCFPTYRFSSLFPYLSPPLLIFPLRIDPLHVQTGCRKRRLNLALVFFVFILCCNAFLLVGQCVLLLC